MIREPSPQVRMVRQIIRITHQAGIRLQFRVALNILLKILLRGLRESRQRHACASEDCAGGQ
jgi:hypothetical protein